MPSVYKTDNRFASELLMPREWMHSLVESKRPLSELLDNVKETGVSTVAASFALIRCLPDGYMFLDVDPDNSIRLCATSNGTRINMPNAGEAFVPSAYRALGVLETKIDSPYGTTYWWKIKDRITLPHPKHTSQSSSEMIREIVDDVSDSPEIAKHLIHAVSGVVGSANSMTPTTDPEKLHTVLHHRFVNRSELKRVTSHPLFSEYLAKKARELALRRSGIQ